MSFVNLFLKPSVILYQINFGGIDENNYKLNVKYELRN